MFGRLFADQKFSKNQTPQKTFQNLKNPPPERPNVDFGVILGAVLALIFDEILYFVRHSENHRNAYI